LRLEAPSSLAIVAAETTVPPAAREALIRLSLHLASRPEQTSADAQAKERTQELKAEAAELVSARIDEAGPCAGVQDLLARALARAEARA